MYSVDILCRVEILIPSATCLWIAAAAGTTRAASAPRCLPRARAAKIPAAVSPYIFKLAGNGFSIFMYACTYFIYCMNI